MGRLRSCCLAAALSLAAAGGALGQADPDALIARFAETVRGDPELVRHARRIRDGESAKAAPLLAAYAQANPQNAEAWFLLSMAYSDTGKPELALSAVRRAYALKPEFREMARVMNARVTATESTEADAAQREAAGAAQSSTQAALAKSPQVGEGGQRSSAAPPVGRYLCLALGGVSVNSSFVSDPVFGAVGLPSVENQPIADITLLPGGRYTNIGSTGSYKFDASTSTITWVGGARASDRTNTVGVFEPVGPTAKYPTIRIRSKADIAQGNKRDLAWCNHAKSATGRD